MIKLREMVPGGVLTVYHGTNAQFRTFSLKNSPQPIIWFTSDKDKIISKEAGAAGSGYIITAQVKINKPAGWKEYDRLGLGQLKDMKYDGAILEDPDGQFDCFVFSPKQIKIIKVEKTT